MVHSECSTGEMKEDERDNSRSGYSVKRHKALKSELET